MRPEAAVATVSCSVVVVASVRAAPATRTEARPPNPLSSATICGIAVICTFSASTAPMALPTARPAAMKARPCRPAATMCRSKSVATMATSMPTAPSRLPRTAVRGWARPFRPKMNSAEAAT